MPLAKPVWSLPVTDGSLASGVVHSTGAVAQSRAAAPELPVGAALARAGESRNKRLILSTWAAIRSSLFHSPTPIPSPIPHPSTQRVHQSTQQCPPVSPGPATPGWLASWGSSTTTLTVRYELDKSALGIGGFGAWVREERRWRRRRRRQGPIFAEAQRAGGFR